MDAGPQIALPSPTDLQTFLGGFLRLPHLGCFLSIGEANWRLRRALVAFRAHLKIMDLIAIFGLRTYPLQRWISGGYPEIPYR